MKALVYNQEGKETGEIILPEAIFEVGMNADLVHQVANSYAANARQVSAHTKNRSEVRGGGRKPWRQKGTGRARHGSTRSPIWVGGGVSGGPRNDKNYSREIPRQMRQTALRMVLSEKAKQQRVVITEGWEGLEPKTKLVASLIKKLPVKKGSRLILYSNKQKNLYLAGRNIPKTTVGEARNVTVLDLLKHQYLLTSKEGVKELET
ncbi:MAG: 50S ribosomal protein L4, partial [Candidatus Saccharimonadales bacterium]